MKPSKATILYSGIIVLAVGLALVSLEFVRPVDCQRFCDAPEQTPCPSGACRPGEQRAGLPLPVLVDDPGGGSPTGGWGILGPEDLPNPMTFGLDVLFYGALLWLMWNTIQVIRGKKRPLEFIAVMLPLALVLACLLLGFLLYRPFLTR
jgi:hypothetical protein